MINNIQNIHTSVVNSTFVGSVVKPSDAMDFFNMSKFRDLTGEKFGRLLVVGLSHKNQHQKYFWHCVCDCGNKKIANGAIMIRGESKSCGCLKSESTIRTFTKHSAWGTPEYRCWMHMKQRCYNNKNNVYKHYGARGIKICDRWLESFENFLEDMGKKPTLKHSIERIEVNGDYNKNNCKWATKAEQSNNKRTSVFAIIGGERKTITEWSVILGFKRGVISSRISRMKCTPEYALSIPIKNKILK